MKIEFDFPFVCILLSLAFQSAAAVFAKQAALMIDDFSLFVVGMNPFYLAMLVCLGFHAFAWQVALRKYPLSFAYFIMSMLPISILLISHFIFHEKVSFGNIIGCLIIVTGLIFLTRNDKTETDV